MAIYLRIYGIKGIKMNKQLITQNQANLMLLLTKFNNEIKEKEGNPFNWIETKYSPNLTIQQKNERYILKELGYQGLLNDNTILTYQQLIKIPYGLEFIITKDNIIDIHTRQWRYDNQMLRVEFDDDFKNLNYITLIKANTLLYLIKNPNSELVARKKHRYFHIISPEQEQDEFREIEERENAMDNFMQILPF